MCLVCQTCAGDTGRWGNQKFPQRPFLPFRAGEIQWIVPFDPFSKLNLQVLQVPYTIILQRVRAALRLLALLFHLDRFRQIPYRKKRNLVETCRAFSHIFLVLSAAERFCLIFRENIKIFCFVSSTGTPPVAHPLRKFEKGNLTIQIFGGSIWKGPTSAKFPKKIFVNRTRTVRITLYHTRQRAMGRGWRHESRRTPPENTGKAML